MDEEETKDEPQPEQPTIEQLMQRIESLEGQVTELTVGQEGIISRMDTMVTTAADNVLPENPENEVLDDVTKDPDEIFDDSNVQKKETKQKRRWGGVF